MSELEVVAGVAGVLAVASLALFAVSIRPSVASGSTWIAAVTAAALGGGWVAVWALAQAAPAGAGWLPTATLAAVAVLTTFGGGPLATATLRLADRREVVPESRHDVAPGSTAAGAAPPTGPATPDVLPGGELIGVLERATVLALLLVDYPEGIAVALAVKGLGRFGELRIPAAPERFIVGTLTSILWAVLGYAAIRAVQS